MGDSIRTSSRAVLVAALGIALAGACGSGTVGSGDDDNDGGGGGGGTSDTGTACASSEQCPVGQTCDPGSSLCTADPVPCTGHDDCGAAAFCTEAGVCEVNDTGGPCDTDTSCIAGEACTGGFCGCSGLQFIAQNVPPNMLIVLDRSGSMDDAIAGGTKWELAVAATKTLLADYGDVVRFGLVLYSSDGDCGPGDVLVDVGNGTAGMINGFLDAAVPDGSTPIGDTLAGLVSYPGLGDDTRDNYVLLLTDGEERCDGDGEAAVGQLRGRTPEVKTFVVGFGAGVDAAALDAMAIAGGTALPGSPKYYQADDAVALQAAFADIGGAVLSCTYDLDGVPPSLDELFVYFDQVGVDRDTSHMDGWDYDPVTNQVTFYGPSCEVLRVGSVEDLVIVYGCPIDIG